MKLQTPTTFDKFKAYVLFTLTVTWTFLPSASLLALPTGENVIHGNVSHQTSGNTMNIGLGASKNIVEYGGYDIGANETVQYTTGLAGPVGVLNKIDGGSPTEIMGNLFAPENVTIHLMNPAGVFFGENSYVNTGALLAVAGNMTNDDYLNGLNQFCKMRAVSDFTKNVAE